MAPGSYTLQIQAGAGYKITIKRLASDFTGCTARMQVMTAPGHDALFTLTIGDGLTIDTVNKTVAVNISAARTATLTQKSYVYNILIVPNVGDPWWLIKGAVAVDPQVTV